jgi:hypothetical protein
MSASYDSVEINYAELRKADRRIAKTVEQALGAAKVILVTGDHRFSLASVQRDRVVQHNPVAEHFVEAVVERVWTHLTTRREQGQDQCQ